MHDILTHNLIADTTFIQKLGQIIEAK